MSDGPIRKVYPDNGTWIRTVDPQDNDIDHIGVGVNGSVYASATGSLPIYRVDQSE